MEQSYLEPGLGSEVILHMFRQVWHWPTVPPPPKLETKSCNSLIVQHQLTTRVSDSLWQCLLHCVGVSLRHGVQWGVHHCLWDRIRPTVLNSYRRTVQYSQWARQSIDILTWYNNMSNIYNISSSVCNTIQDQVCNTVNEQVNSINWDSGKFYDGHRH